MMGVPFAWIIRTANQAARPATLLDDGMTKTRPPWWQSGLSRSVAG